MRKKTEWTVFFEAVTIIAEIIATIEKKYYEDDEDDRSIELSFSSETPYERSFGMEIIDHDKMDLSFLGSGNAPFLADHDATKVIGIVEKVNIANARGRAKVRFGKNDLANSIFQDIKDGIRPNISFGYEVLSFRILCFVRKKRSGPDPK